MLRGKKNYANVYGYLSLRIWISVICMLYFAWLGCLAFWHYLTDFKLLRGWLVVVVLQT